MKVVEAGYKLDLHIHSCYSRVKDGKKVAFNTLENIGVLISKLNENGVQICAITDHDTFSYELYKELKFQETVAQTSIEKVFPGVEFSVEFKGDDAPAVVHVIAVFDDSDDEKIARINSIICDADGKPQYNSGMAFTEEKFLALLREIDVDTVLIAHQKETLTTKSKPKKSDANSVGEERFQELVYTEFFEAFEFKNKRNEIFNKQFLSTHGAEDDIRFITGSDCHDWRVYPKETENDKSEFIYSYIKCLPTFRGLVMAITDHRRIKRVNSFFNIAETYLPQIDFIFGNQITTVPMSRGLNVIIGDNSIGKSLLLHKLTGYIKQKSKGISRNLVSSYNKYLRDNRIKIDTCIEESQLFGFDMQGEVRSKFEEGKINTDDFLKSFYPPQINSAPYIEIVQRQLDRVYDYLGEKFELERLEACLGRFKLEDYHGVPAESISFIGNPTRDISRSAGYGKVNSDVLNLIEQLNTLQGSRWLNEDDLNELQTIKNLLDRFAKKFADKKRRVDIENRRIALFQSVINDFKQRYGVSVSDVQKKMSAYNESINSTREQLVELIRRREKNIVPQISLEPVDIGIETNRVYSYEFNSRLTITRIDIVYFWDLFTRALKKDNRIPLFDMSRDQLRDALPYYEGPDADVLSVLKTKVQNLLEEDFKPKYTITQYDMDKTRELSAGFNAQIYFDLLSYADDKGGIYIIDQPEDNIAQKAIHEYLLARFKTMGEHRQVIIVTHNPQFIVNLDVDNVIFLGKDADNRFIVQSGALEYKCEDYNMLDIISNHIEGGLDTLQRRWKRYEKNNRISSS